MATRVTSIDCLLTRFIYSGTHSLGEQLKPGSWTHQHDKHSRIPTEQKRQCLSYMIRYS
jgi:hypothetical protein